MVPTAGRRAEEVLNQQRRAPTWNERLSYGAIVSVSPFVLSVEQFFDRVDTNLPYEPLLDDDGYYMTAAKWVTKPLKEFVIDELVASQYQMRSNRIQHAATHKMEDYEKAFGDPYPYIVVFQGTPYLLDGHHRTIAERLEGKKTVLARYIVRESRGEDGLGVKKRDW
jgi:hypothetical protein